MVSIDRPSIDVSGRERNQSSKSERMIGALEEAREEV